jgi:hypothetical protein
MFVRFREPSLAELLEDPLVRRLMASDGVTDAALSGLIKTVRPEQAMHDYESIACGPNSCCCMP